MYKYQVMLNVDGCDRGRRIADSRSERELFKFIKGLARLYCDNGWIIEHGGAIEQETAEELSEGDTDWDIVLSGYDQEEIHIYWQYTAEYRRWLRNTAQTSASVDLSRVVRKAVKYNTDRLKRAAN